MSRITAKEIKKIAQISNLEIHDQEMDGIIKQIESVLSYAARVQEVASTVSADQTRNINVMREDVIGASQADAILAQAPERQDRFFVVPAILEHK